jgi:hypothetical protein
MIWLLLWAFLGPVLSVAFLQWNSPLSPKYQGHRFLGIKRTTLEAWIFYIIGGPGVFLTSVFILFMEVIREGGFKDGEN